MGSRTSFRDIDWTDPSGGRRVSLRNAVTGLALLAVSGLYVYSKTMIESGDPVIFGWSLRPLNWLWALSLIALGYAVWPLAANPQQAIRYLRRLSRNYLATAAGLYLLAFLITGTIGPMFLTPPEPAFEYGYLPPFGFSVDAGVAQGCKNLVGDNCWGTLQFPLGTTAGGESILNHIVYGTRLVVQIGMVMALIVVPLATLAGTVAAGYGGRIDDIITAIIDIERTIPALFVYLTVRLFTGSGTIFLLVVIFGLINAGAVASVVRSRALDEVQKDYIQAARSAGASRWEVIRTHVMPNVSHVALTGVILQIPMLIITEATLSYLKVGFIQPGSVITIPPNVISWGRLIARDVTRISAVWWPVFFPIMALFITILAINVFGEGVRQAFAPEAQ